MADRRRPLWGSAAVAWLDAGWRRWAPPRPDSSPIRQNLPRRNNSNIVSLLIDPARHAATTACKSWLDIPAIPESLFNFNNTSAFVSPFGKASVEFQQVGHAAQAAVVCGFVCNGAVGNARLFRCSLYSGPTQYFSLFSDGSIMDVVKII